MAAESTNEAGEQPAGKASSEYCGNEALPGKLRHILFDKLFVNGGRLMGESGDRSLGLGRGPFRRPVLRSLNSPIMVQGAMGEKITAQLLCRA